MAVWKGSDLETSVPGGEYRIFARFGEHDSLEVAVAAPGRLRTVSIPSGTQLNQAAVPDGIAWAAGDTLLLHDGRRILRWKIGSLERLPEWTFPGDGSFAISQDGSTLALLSAEPPGSRVGFYDLNGAHAVREVALPKATMPLAFTPDGATAFILGSSLSFPGAGDQLTAVPVTDLGDPATIPLPQAPCCLAGVDTSGSRLWLASPQSGDFLLYDVFHHTDLRRLHLSFAPTAVAFAPSGDPVILGLADGSVLAWHSGSADPPVAVTRLRGQPVDISFYRGGRGLVVTSSSGEIAWLTNEKTLSMRAVTYWIESAQAWLTVDAAGHFNRLGNTSFAVDSAAGGSASSAAGTDIISSLLAEDRLSEN
jgi:hypothetical protein